MANRPEESWSGGSLTLTCPNDGLALFVDVQPVLIGDKATVRVGHHVHVGFNVRATCADGHQWQIKDDILLIEQVS